VNWIEDANESLIGDGGGLGVAGHRARPVLLLAVCVLTLTASCAPSADEGKAGNEKQRVFALETRHIAEGPKEFRMMGQGSAAMIRIGPERPFPLKAEPQYKSTPMYGCAVAGKGMAAFVTDAKPDPASALVMAFDESRPGKGYDVVYVDGNRDLRLTKDERLAGDIEEQEGMKIAWFGPVEALLPDAEEPQTVGIMCYQMAPPEPAAREGLTVEGGLFGGLFGMMVSGTYREGDVRFGDTTYRVALFDMSGNGDFNDTGGEAEFPVMDMMLIDEDADGTYEFDSAAMLLCFLARYVSVGEDYYEIEVEADGSQMRVAKYAGPVGLLRTSTKGWATMLMSPDGGVAVRDGAREVSLPAGEYRVFCKSVTRRDAKGRTWRLMTVSEDADPISITPEKPTELLLGGPLNQVIETQVADGMVSISLSLTDAAHGRVAALMVGDEQPPAPTLKIVSAAGKTVHTGSLEYG
jgi:hypothetical protein